MSRSGGPSRRPLCEGHYTQRSKTQSNIGAMKATEHLAGRWQGAQMKVSAPVAQLCKRLQLKGLGRVCVVVVVVKGTGRGVEKKENCRTSDINIPPLSKSNQEAPGTQSGRSQEATRKQLGSSHEAARKQSGGSQVTEKQPGNNLDAVRKQTGNNQEAASKKTGGNQETTGNNQEANRKQPESNRK